MMRFRLSLLPLLVLLCSPYSAAAAATARKHTSQHNPASTLVRSSCRHATYPKICLRTLSDYAGPAKTPRDLAQASVSVSLARARRVSGFLAQLSANFLGTKRQRSAIGDCVDLMSSSVDELSETLGELQHLREETFRFQMSNAQTWLSAALTDDDTCLDGIQEADVKAKAADVKRKIKNAARVTSNALYLINRLDEIRGRPRSRP
ncbi:pectinesterase inhibitor 3-like [Pyrus x bretschneideri]|uniref:pectinesterase inhibitor 3-like n=1 Tax=Pyrus x bretschneideri TaxID=225117 RepID=UPI00202F44A0|nr:pectinesterase inhibitor 3-like [Pyrus x bretschneideri]